MTRWWICSFLWRHIPLEFLYLLFLCSYLLSIPWNFYLELTSEIWNTAMELPTKTNPGYLTRKQRRSSTMDLHYNFHCMTLKRKGAHNFPKIHNIIWRMDPGGSYFCRWYIPACWNSVNYGIIRLLLQVELLPRGTKRKPVIRRLSQQRHHYLTC